MGDGPDEKVTTPSMPAVDPWARVDRLEGSIVAHAERCAERFGKADARAEAVTERCTADFATLTRQIAASAGSVRGLEGRVVELERWRPIADGAVKRATADAADAKQGAENSIQEMRGMRDGLIGHLARSEAATLEREEAKRAEREDAAREGKAERDADEARRVQATAKHEARFESLGDAVARQAAGIVTVGGAVTQLANRALLAFIVVSLVVVVGVVVVVVTVLASRPTETVVAPHRALGEPK